MTLLRLRNRTHWFVETQRNGSSENQSHRFIGVKICLLYDGFFLLPSCGRLLLMELFFYHITVISTTSIPSTIRYQPNTLKSCCLLKLIRNLITKTDTANATAIPRTRANSYSLVKSNQNFNSLKALAPSIVGTARKKVNSAAVTRETPMSKAPIIVAPDRDVPGISDNT